MLTFKEVKTRSVILTLKRPIKAKIAYIKKWPILLVDLYTNEGIVGRSYLQPYIDKSLKYISSIIDDFNEVLRNKELAPYDNFELMRQSLHFIGYEGLSLTAVSGVDMAIWDAVSKAAAKPLCCYLGGTVGPVKAYNSNGLWLEKGNVLTKEAKLLIEQGNFSAIKMRLGRDSFNDDLKAIETVKKAIGTEVKLMVDFNQCLSLEEALNKCRALEQFDLTWIEEPLIYDNLQGYSQLTREIKTPIQLGENFYGPRELYKAIEQKASDLVMPDFMRIGGVTGWINSAAIAGAGGIPISTHFYPEVGSHVMRVSQSAHWLEWLDWADDILLDPFNIIDGYVQIPNKPGIGIEWNEKVINKHLL
jgi:mandelate racemase